MVKVSFILVFFLFISGCTMESSDPKDKVSFGILTVNSIDTGEDGHIGLNFNSTAENSADIDYVKISTVSFSTWGFWGETKIQVSNGCTVERDVNRFTVRCDDFLVVKEIASRLDIWIQGPWDMIELTSVRSTVCEDASAKSCGNDANSKVFNTISAGDSIRFVNSD